MPLFEYVCRTCDHHFETLVSGGRTPSCPSCHGADLDKQFSVFAVSSPGPRPTNTESVACGTCGDPRGAGACRLN